MLEFNFVTSSISDIFEERDMLCRGQPCYFASEGVQNIVMRICVCLSV